MKHNELREIKVDELKKIAVEGLVTFHNICKKYDLRYYLAYGTLLGAVRHKGFIPWDDDIDLWMQRPDYNRLIELTDEIESEEWGLQSFEKNNKYYFQWAKFCHKKSVIAPSRFTSGFLYGESIDIFPLDVISESSDFNMVGKIAKTKKISSRLSTTNWGCSQAEILAR